MYMYEKMRAHARELSEDDMLLRHDLSARLMYGVKCEVSDLHICKTYELTGIYTDGCEFEHNGAFYGFDSFTIKPYLRKMSSMTEEERDEYHRLQHDVWHSDMHPTYYDSVNSIDWLLENHFDFRGLIEKGLAIEAPELFL